MTVVIRDFPDRSALALGLCDAVAEALADAARANGNASLAVPGGTTPGLFLRALGEKPLDWAKIAVTLTDERCVGPDHERSNALLLRQTLMTGEAAKARFIPLFEEGSCVEASLVATDALLAGSIVPLDVVVLGMGNDGHTASLFPGADRLAEALDPHHTANVIALAAPGAPEPRISLTMAALSSARHVFLLIAGDDKRATLDRVIEPGSHEDAPVRAILSGDRPVTVYWAP